MAPLIRMQHNLRYICGIWNDLKVNLEMGAWTSKWAVKKSTKVNKIMNFYYESHRFHLSKQFIVM
jgi:L-arabinose isomerase